MPATLTLELTAHQRERLLELVVQSPDAKGKKALTEQLIRKNRPNVPLRVGDKSASYLGLVFRLHEQDPVIIELAKRAERNLQDVKRSAARARANDVTLSNPKNDTRDKTVRHLTGRPRPLR